MFLQEMNKDERRAFEAMFDMCETFMTVAEDLEAIAEDEDGQPDEAQEWADFDADC
jgi:hypothetical protein